MRAHQYLLILIELWYVNKPVHRQNQTWSVCPQVFQHRWHWPSHNLSNMLYSHRLPEIQMSFYHNVACTDSLPKSTLVQHRVCCTHVMSRSRCPWWNRCRVWLAIQCIAVWLRRTPFQGYSNFLHSTSWGMGSNACHNTHYTQTAHMCCRDNKSRGPCSCP